jgi:hypothetical protein
MGESRWMELRRRSQIDCPLRGLTEEECGVLLRLEPLLPLLRPEHAELLDAILMFAHDEIEHFAFKRTQL